jgi:hypothetical protein
MLIRHISDGGAAGQVGEMHSGEGEQGVQDIAVGRADPDDSRKSVSTTSAFPRFSAKPYVGIC